MANTLHTDQGWLKVMEHCSHGEIEKEEKYVHHHFTCHLAQTLIPGQAVDAQTLCAYLDQCSRLIETELSEMASYYSKLQWLWYLRRLPIDIFSGELDTTFGYDSMLAETLTGLHGRSGAGLKKQSKVLVFDVNRSIMRRVIRLAHGVRFLSQIHSAYRRSGKGQPFEFMSGDPLPHFIESGPDEAAIELYDRRVAEGKATLGIGRAGTLFGNSSFENIKSNSEDSIMAVFRIKETIPTPTFLQTQEGLKTEIEVLARFHPTFINLSGLRRLNNMLRDNPTSVWSRQVVGIICLLRLGIYQIVYGTSALAKVLEYGYIVTDPPSFQDIFKQGHDWIVSFVGKVFPSTELPEDVDSLIEMIEQTPGSMWPLKPHGIFRYDRGFLCVDLYGASMLLNAAMEYPRHEGGEVANIRSLHFEETVQEIISISPWKPPSEILQYKRRKLRASGQGITDIDAIGKYNKSLLLVSCKSLVYSSEYDKGYYSVIRNSAQTITNAVLDWKQKIEFLERNKEGDNYDFTSFDHFIGVVCSPYPVYVPIGPATDLVSPGLKACCSAGELSDWLSTNTAAV